MNINPGIRVLAEHAARHKSLLDAHDDRMSKNENPKIIAFLKKSKAAAASLMAEAHKLANETTLAN